MIRRFDEALKIAKALPGAKRSVPNENHPHFQAEIPVRATRRGAWREFCRASSPEKRDSDERNSGSAS
jgi:hypothetical protein